MNKTCFLSLNNLQQLPIGFLSYIVSICLIVHINYGFLIPKWGSIRAKQGFQAYFTPVLPLVSNCQVILSNLRYQSLELGTCFIIFLKFLKMGRSRSSDGEEYNSKRSYARISLKRRKMLINLVTKEGYSIAKAIKKLSLKLTTARFILQKYRESGTFPMKKFKRCVRMMRDLPEEPPKIQSKDSITDGLKQAAVKLEEREQDILPSQRPYDPFPASFWVYYWQF